MENATKVLIMAATVLISVVIVSFAIYLATSLSSYSSEITEQTTADQIAQFNAQFTQYQYYKNTYNVKDENGKDVENVEENTTTIYDIITVANLAKENNENYGFDTYQGNATENTLYITVAVDGNGIKIDHFESKLSGNNYVSNFVKSKENMDAQMTSEYDSNRCRN